MGGREERTLLLDRKETYRGDESSSDFMGSGCQKQQRFLGRLTRVVGHRWGLGDRVGWGERRAGDRAFQKQTITEQADDTRERCHEGAGAQAFSSLAPKFWVNKAQASFSVLMLGFGMRQEQEGPQGLETPDTEQLSRRVLG